MSTVTDLTKAKRKRTAKKNIVLNDVFPECEKLISGTKNAETLAESEAVLESLVDLVAEVKILDEQVSELTVDDTEYAANEKSAYEFALKARKIEGKMKAFINQPKDVKPCLSDNSRVQSDSQGRAKLPKIDIQKFNGNALNWRTFIESFDAMVHARSDISNIERFAYLREFLVGNALQTIEGMPLTSDNYVKAKELLEKRYGNQQLIVSSHMNALLKIDCVSNSNVRELRKLHDKVEMNIRALDSAGVSSQNIGPLLIPIVLERLPDVVRLQISRILGTDNWDIKEFMAAINAEISARESYECLKGEPKDESEKISTLQSLATGSTSKECIFCGSGSHFRDKCDVVTNIDLRKTKLKELRCCYKCLRKNHISRNCKDKRVFCHRCKQKNRHDTSICDTDLTQLAIGSDKSVLLQSAVAYLSDVEERKLEEVNLLLDNCSQQTFVTEKVVAKLGLVPVQEKNRRINAFGSNTGKGMRLKEYRIVLKPIDKSSSITIDALAIPTICAPVCRKYHKLAKEQNGFLNELKLADSTETISNRVDLLVGADVYWEIVTGNLKRNPKTGLVAISSTLGWLMNGPVDTTAESGPGMESSLSVKALCVEFNEDEEKKLSDGIRNFWSLDVVGISENEELSSKAENLRDVKINPVTGRYSCELPIKEDHPMMPDNYTICKKRLLKLKDKLDGNEELKQSYDKIFKDQLNAGVFEKVSDSGTVGHVTYLPHREVVRSEKSTTKVRAVFDGGAKRKNHCSLNEILHTGPNLLPKVFELLLKFRIHQVALTADIEKAYLQIEVDEKHRDYLRFLYYADIFATDPEIVSYRFCRLPFGISPSQSIMIDTIRKHGEKYEEVDPDFARMTKEHFFSDDLNTGADNDEDGLKIYKKTRIRFAAAHFNVRKWRTNSEKLRKKISDDDRSDVDDEKVLGIKWNHSRDTLHMNVSELFEMAEKVPPTKRNILKIMAKIYDPVGFLTPITVSLHLLFQDIWLKGVDWDEYVGEDLEKQWMSVVKLLKTSADMVINRRYFIVDVNDPFECVYLHGFSDASKRVYAGCVYLQAVTRSGNVQVSFVTSKSRVKPARQDFTIPKMETLGSYVLATLMKKVYTTLTDERKIDDYFCWTDAKVTLAWIRAENRKFTVFLQNRLNKIRRNVDVKRWEYIPTNDNPADVITRFYTGNLSECKLWWNGPDLIQKVPELSQVYSNTIEAIVDDTSLHNGDELDSNSYNLQLSDAELEEFRAELIDTSLSKEKDVVNGVSVMVALSNNQNTSPVGQQVNDISTLINIDRFSTLNNLLNVSSWLLRFINNVQMRGVRRADRLLHSYITSEERSVALKRWIYCNQARLKENPKFKDIRSSLNLVEDQDKILHAPGRIQRAVLPDNRNSPIMLERSHRLAELILWECHDRVWHNGRKETRTEFQSQYWVTNCYSFVSRILYRCVICRFLNSRAYSYPKSPELPELRFNDENAFSICGVDHFGPFHCKNDYGSTINEDNVHECHAVLYTCSSTRGLILDLVPSTSSKDFINSFKRFIARRGCPQKMLSDHGSAFVATKTQMFATEKNVSWTFTLTKAPWHGAIWERLVQSVKRCLKKVIGNTMLTFIELQTVLFQIEVILNNRPLCQLEDGDVVEPLTPNHLMFGRKLSQVNTKSESNDVRVDSSNSAKKRVQYLETVVQHYWERWRKEYVVSLRNWNNYKRKNALIPAIDDIVLIFEDKVSRHKWLMGRIVELVPSQDGNIRGAKVLVGKTRSIIERPINHLYPVEFAVERNLHDNESMTSHSNSIEIVDTSKENSVTNVGRPKRRAAEVANIKLKFK